MAGKGEGARAGLRTAIKSVSDVIMLVSCRTLTSEELASQGMPVVLKKRLLALFPWCREEERFSRFGDSKYHLFNDGGKFSRRWARIKQKVDVSMQQRGM